MNRGKGTLWILAAAALWGLSATGAKVLQNQGVGTLLIVQTRVTISCLLMLAFFTVKRPDLLRVRTADLWRLILIGLVGVAGTNFTYYYTIKESTVALAILLQYLAPLAVMGFAVWKGDEEISPGKVAAALAALFGCFLAVGGLGSGDLRLSPLALFTGILSMVGFAFMTVYPRYLFVRYSVLTVQFYAVLFASLFWLVVHPPWTTMGEPVSAETWGALAALSVGSVLIPYSLYLAGLRRVVPSRAIIISTFEPVVAIVSAAVVLGEAMDALRILGAVLVLGAIVALQVRPDQKRPVVAAREPMEMSDAP
jgi:drug/metabolite transporter (DMT)-like permease